MLNKYKLFLVPLCLLLVGCSAQKNQGKEKQTATQASKVSQSQAKSSQTAAASQSSSATSKSSAANSSSSSSQSQQQNTNRLAQFNQELKANLKDTLIPQADGLATGSDKLNVRYQGNTANYTISYSVGAQAKEFNDSSISQEIPYAEFAKKTYSSADEAGQQINHQTASDSQGLPEIDLGHNIKGYLDSGAGQRYLSWNEGNWALRVHAAAVNNEDPQQLAKQTVELLETYRPPAPDPYGEVRFDTNTSYGSRNQVIVWQKGNTIYQLSGHSAETAIKMAASIK
ncbi:hypothetical protein [Liquorilactobacillus oeni]|uniref:Lipoprotein n=1 Tax=Liquorilactobacillus oeni DSM 19972 TaxID=1423777 RepID=A0A0R1MCL0_9LACO|nr:hypothetical protein [Liquorilactobacillus oeni]KRL05788.1 lipoprotein [Liquorilactobacillus oeni DSM 19972]